MPVQPDNKYALQDLYAEIDLFDRKIAHSQKYASFDSERERESAIGKLVSKRAALVKTAVGMTSRGVECNPKYLPRSFKAMATGLEVAS